MGNRKLPFGYKMVMGEIVVHPQEAQAVQGIYARYLAGASFNDITDHLKEKGPPYDADKPWNKNMVARILEDNRYTGTIKSVDRSAAEQRKAYGFLTNSRNKRLQRLAASYISMPCEGVPHCKTEHSLF